MIKSKFSVGIMFFSHRAERQIQNSDFHESTFTDQFHALEFRLRLIFCYSKIFFKESAVW